MPYQMKFDEYYTITLVPDGEVENPTFEVGDPTKLTLFQHPDNPLICDVKGIKDVVTDLEVPVSVTAKADPKIGVEVGVISETFEFEVFHPEATMLGGTVTGPFKQ